MVVINSAYIPRLIYNIKFNLIIKTFIDVNLFNRVNRVFLFIVFVFLLMSLSLA